MNWAKDLKTFTYYYSPSRLGNKDTEMNHLCLPLFSWPNPSLRLGLLLKEGR